jgi:hypothetical protein
MNQRPIKKTKERTRRIIKSTRKRTLVECYDYMHHVASEQSNYYYVYYCSELLSSPPILKQSTALFVRSEHHYDNNNEDHQRGIRSSLPRISCIGIRWVRLGRIRPWPEADGKGPSSREQQQQLQLLVRFAFRSDPIRCRLSFPRSTYRFIDLFLFFFYSRAAHGWALRPSSLMDVCPFPPMNERKASAATSSPNSDSVKTTTAEAVAILESTLWR